MALVPFTSTTSIATLRSNFDDARAQLLANAQLGQKDFEIPLDLQGRALDASVDLSRRSVAFTLGDDAALRCITAAFSYVTAVSTAFSVAVVVDDGTTVDLLDRAVSASASFTGAGGYGVQLRNFSFTGTDAALWLFAGVRYRLVATAAGGTFSGVNCVAQLRSRRRRA